MGHAESVCPYWPRCGKIAIFARDVVVILLSALNKNDLIQHPKGGVSFGIIPEISQHSIQEGRILLRKGDHWERRGKAQGFGVVHIWTAHEYDLRKLGYLTIEDVALYVAHVTQPGTPIYCDIHDTSDNRRLTVLRSHYGLLALEPRSDRSGFGYYVVTAYPKRQATGVCVGVTK